jgi:hypothetical protein
VAKLVAATVKAMVVIIVFMMFPEGCRQIATTNSG